MFKIDNDETRATKDLSQDVSQAQAGEKQMSEANEITRSSPQVTAVAELIRRSIGKAAEAGSPPVAKISELSEDGEERLKQALIYVVDDEESILRLLGRILGRKGFNNIKYFNDGAEVLPALFANDGTLREAPDLFILDTQMPIMDGPKLYVQLMKISEQLRPNVIAISGGMRNNEQWDKEVSFLHKPFDSATLLNLIRAKLIAKLQLEQK